jgi:LysM repeat protein/murein endopeptidase
MGGSPAQAAAEAEEDEGDDAESTDEGEDADEETAAVEEEGESHDVATGAADIFRYTADISDEELLELWKSSPEALGSVSLGFVDEGRMINALRFPPSDSWRVVSPERAFATQETITYVITAIEDVRAQFPGCNPLRVNQLSSSEGGYLRGHKSHQNGRDVDLAFYYPTVDPIRARAREKYIDVAKNWALLKSLVTKTDVQFVLVDKRVQKVLYDFALKNGEDKAWLDSVFNGGKEALVKHARRHRDHFHVRFYNGRAQELGRRVAPLLAQRPEQNVAFHRVRSGDTLGAIARRYGSSIAALKKANRLRSSFLRLAQQLRVPLRGPCTHCPVPPPVVVPDRRLPPLQPPSVQMASTSPAPTPETPAIKTASVQPLSPEPSTPESPAPPSTTSAVMPDSPAPATTASVVTPSLIAPTNPAIAEPIPVAAGAQ